MLERKRIPLQEMVWVMVIRCAKTIKKTPIMMQSTEECFILFIHFRLVAVTSNTPGSSTTHEANGNEL
jgi:hypothetical protein